MAMEVDKDLERWLRLDVNGRVQGSVSFYNLYKTTGQVNALDYAIRLGEDALNTINEDDSVRPGYLSNLSVYYGSRFERRGNQEDLEKAIQAAEKAVAATSDPNVNPDLGRHLSNLSNRYSSRFRRFGKREDLEKAIQAAERAVAVISKGQDLAACLSNLSIRYGFKFKRFGIQEGLEKAIETAERAIAITSKNSPDLANRLNNLSMHYDSRYSRFGKQEDLEKAIQAVEQAIIVTSKSNPNLPSRLNNLSVYYNSKFLNLGNQEDLEKAIQVAEQAVAATSGDSPDLPGRLTNLSNCYNSRFRRLGDQEDLERAIQAAERAVTTTPKTNPDLAAYLNNLSNHYNSKFSRLGKDEDLEKVIQTSEQAVAATPDDSPDLPSRLNNLSIRYALRFKKLGNGLEKAIQTAERAIAVTPKDNPDLVNRLNNLSVYYNSKFNTFKKDEDLEKAIQAAEQAVAATPEDSPKLATCLSNLSTGYYSKFNGLGKQEDLEKAVNYMKEAFTISWVSPISRIEKGIRLYKLYLMRQDSNRAADAAADATMLLPRISPRYISRRDHEHVLSQVSGLASTACALVLETGRPAVDALKLIEVGRGVMAGLAIESQTDVSILKEYDLELYERYENLRYQLSAIQDGKREFFLESQASESDQHRPFYIERDLHQIENEIREIPQFSSFQLPPSVEELKNLAHEGPIVAFNVTTIRSDALIITNTDIKALALGNFNYSEVELRLSNIDQISNRHPAKLADNNDEMKGLLRWLWIFAVKPILKELGFLVSRSLQNPVLPRIWWITNGVMGSAPLHAAGIYDDAEEENAMDFVVSSYISTVKALKFTRAKLQMQRTGAQGEVLLITASDEELEFEEEIRAIENVVGKHYESISIKDKSREDVLHRLENSSIIHFACHGVSIDFEPSSEPPRSPSDSYLLLRSQKGDLGSEKLTIDDLAKVRHPRAWLAYLSACSTAKISADRLVDETIHIANAFQLAGFPHVVGTLWEADNECAMMVSKTFYENLLGSASDGPRHNNIGRALHQAIRRLMQDNWFKDDYLAWVPFIHVGA
ncbi:hypothetical protein TWF506_008792 [Arthrobotrys conoides]|uniref:CHAT domain-containing protein n=1 Tax=Arthrobotrys conoides TaxID=74498 RepID=A0AAN8RUA9_9PEZI